MADVQACPGCGEDVVRGQRQSCDRCGYVIPEPTVDVPTWEGQAPFRWYVNGYMRALAQRDHLPGYLRMELRVPWLWPTVLFGLAILNTLYALSGPRTLPWLWPMGAVMFGVLGAVNIAQERALKIAVDELRRHGLLRES